MTAESTPIAPAIDRPYIVLSCAMSIDGCIDDAGATRLLLSNAADFDRIDALRATCDAILVGAATIRKDNPHLIVRSAARRRERLARGQAASPLKVTLTRSARLACAANFFTAGDSGRLVYCVHTACAAATASLERLTTLVDAGADIDLHWLCGDLHRRGVRRLLVEGGAATYTAFLTEGLADELQLAVAPLFVGDAHARRMVGDGRFPWNAAHRADLVEVCRVGDVALLRYALSPRFQRG